MTEQEAIPVPKLQHANFSSLIIFWGLFLSLVPDVIGKMTRESTAPYRISHAWIQGILHSALKVL
ncbi:hypothetical protein [Acidithiobacillus ferridurans]|uniref:hypothetical protein n=1 Tax=Acidithiobacillus ferridurans TaxID=1232575 RepID=UPI001C0680EE|nr:hypothetical protein [Acidithiobacillus ferridurans]MBU2734064.1 hypothetical protein [Acidithiobacillus ferridurans]